MQVSLLQLLFYDAVALTTSLDVQPCPMKVAHARPM